MRYQWNASEDANSQSINQSIPLLLLQTEYMYIAVWRERGATEPEPASGRDDRWIPRYTGTFILYGVHTVQQTKPPPKNLQTHGSLFGLTLTLTLTPVVTTLQIQGTLLFNMVVGRLDWNNNLQIRPAVSDVGGNH